MFSVTTQLMHVIAMLRNLIPLIKENYPQLEKVNYLTDSPTFQYQNKTIFTLLCNPQNEFERIHAKLDYLEAGHGKGPCDGLGASVKRSVDMAIKQSKATIQIAEDFLIGPRTVQIILLFHTFTYHKRTTINAIEMLEPSVII